MLAYSTWSFVHARLVATDTRELERLYEQRRFLTGSSLEQNFQMLTQLLEAVAPAVYMRQEFWVALYFYALRAASPITALASAVNHELRRLVAYQANRYSEACARLADMSAVQ
jgi:hypothetical protein